MTFCYLGGMSPKSINDRTPQEIEHLKALGANIRKWRERKGLTQEQFAPVVGFTRSYITEIETGKRNISFGYLNDEVMMKRMGNSDHVMAKNRQVQARYFRRIFLSLGLRTLIDLPTTTSFQRGALL